MEHIHIAYSDGWSWKKPNTLLCHLNGLGVGLLLALWGWWLIGLTLIALFEVFLYLLLRSIYNLYVR